MCDMDPPLPLIAAPLTVGTEWAAESRCVHRQDPDNDDRDRPPIAYAIRGRVNAVEEVGFRGKRFRAYAVALAEHSAQPDGDGRPGYVSDEKRDLLYVPALGLTVREHTTRTTEYRGGSAQYSSSSRGGQSRRLYELVGLE